MPAPTVTPPAAGDGFAIHLVAGREDAMPLAYTDAAWQDVAATATLGQVLIGDAAIEAVSVEPLTLLLAPGVDAPATGQMFVATLDGARLYAGGVVPFYSAKARHYPVLNVYETGLATYVVVAPRLGDQTDSALTAPPALVEHFRRRGVVQPGARRPAPTLRARRMIAAVTATKPGDPTSQVEVACDAAGVCALTLSYRMPGTAAPAWDQTETITVPVADADALWALVESLQLFRFDPVPATRPPRDLPVHPPRYRIAVAATRADGTERGNDKAWQTPSVVDDIAVQFLHAAGALGAKHAKTVPVNYFP